MSMHWKKPAHLECYPAPDPAQRGPLILACDTTIYPHVARGAVRLVAAVPDVLEADPASLNGQARQGHASTSKDLTSST